LPGDIAAKILAAIALPPQAAPGGSANAGRAETTWARSGQIITSRRGAAETKNRSAVDGRRRGSHGTIRIRFHHTSSLEIVPQRLGLGAQRVVVEVHRLCVDEHVVERAPPLGLEPLTDRGAPAAELRVP